jgi:asparagine synthase (glutamine-hydrolysing)
MCGICGLAGPRASTVPDVVLAMSDTIAHRGPDGAGLQRFDAAVLGHRRLSVIDLSGGAQPMANEDGTIWVTFNGEIYNHKELRARLEARGHRFRTHCDTEVLVHGYEEFGEDLPRLLNGMFAFAVYDTRTRRLFLARDHLGIKPLFYSMQEGTLYFASEIKAILAAWGTCPECDPDALQEYLIFRYIAGERTLWQGIHRLPPGHRATWQGGRLQISPFWQVGELAPPVSITRGDEVEQLEERLDAAVSSQLMSDVPLGTFCSGGVDSGLVTALTARHAGDRLHTFSVGFADPRWDESALALDTARRYGTEHHVLRSDPHGLLEVLRELLWYHDEPLSHPNSVPLFFLSRFAREHVTVILTGEGADELLCGYPRYHLARLARMPQAARRVGAQLARRVPHHRAGLLARVLPRTVEDAVVLNSAYVEPELVTGLTGRPWEPAIRERREIYRRSVVPGDPIATISRFELQTYLVCALDRMDRMAMASGLEARVPFLDIPMVEWAVNLPSKEKLQGTRTKRVLKALAGRYLSPRIVHGPKSGFGLPLGVWFRGSELAPLRDMILNDRHPAAAHFRPKVMESLVADHMSGRADNSELLWLVANCYVWFDIQAGAHELAPRIPHRPSMDGDDGPVPGPTS